MELKLCICIKGLEKLVMRCVPEIISVVVMDKNVKNFICCEKEAIFFFFFLHFKFRNHNEYTISTI